MQLGVSSTTSTVVVPLTTSPATTAASSSAASISPGAIAGIVIGVVVGVALIAFLIAYVTCISNRGVTTQKVVPAPSDMDSAAAPATHEPADAAALGTMKTTEQVVWRYGNLT